MSDSGIIKSHFKCGETPYTVEWGLDADKRIAALEADNRRLEQGNETWRVDFAKLQAENERLREALKKVSRLEPYDGNSHVYNTAGKVARKALAALQESE